jgi:hypothetical protein
MMALLFAVVAALTFYYSFSDYLDYRKHVAAFHHGYVQTAIPGTRALAWAKEPAP